MFIKKQVVVDSFVLVESVVSSTWLYRQLDADLGGMAGDLPPSTKNGQKKKFLQVDQKTPVCEERLLSQSAIVALASMAPLNSTTRA